MNLQGEYNFAVALMATMLWIMLNQSLPGHAGEVGQTQETTHWLYAFLNGQTSKVRFVL